MFIIGISNYRTKGKNVMTSYQDFLEQKHISVKPSGFDVEISAISSQLYPFQRDVVVWALRLGKAALFEERGLGKTIQELEWAHQVARHTDRCVLILAPLAVAHQSVQEAAKFGYALHYVQNDGEITKHHAASNANVFITNYERLDNFDTSAFSGIVLDESSILKAYTGKIKRAILEAFASTPYKLAASATPAPNDHLELGNHAEFLDVMASNEMISRWFINDSMEAGNYRLKKHAAKDFWRWLTSWAVCLSTPDDLGTEYALDGFTLPPLHIHEHLVDTNQITIDRAWADGRLFPDSAPSSTQLHKVKRESLKERIAQVVSIAEGLNADEPLILWCDTNDESDALQKAFPNAIEVRGSDTVKHKIDTLTAFTEGRIKQIITKPDIAGMGLNWQHAAYMIFVGVGYSFEKFYQALGRSHRYGQTREVHAHLIYAQTEGDVLLTLHQKKALFAEMQRSMNAAMHEYGLFRNDNRRELTTPQYEASHGENWTLYLGDCVPVTAALPDNSIDFGIHSPPFTNLYIYSDSESDMGNAVDDSEFFAHYEYLIKDMYRVTRPGRLCAVHCKDLPQYMNRDGAAGLRDFPGDIIRAFERHGWQFHSRVTIWKDPVIEMQRTKNHGLLHKNFAERAEACRQGMADYLVVFRKWPVDGGEEVKHRREVGDYIGTSPPRPNEFRIGKRSEQDNYSIAVWQRYASPVWFDIDQTNVLNHGLARDGQDEKHICPLQLDVIARSIDLWTNPGDTVFSPFAGVGSEGYQAVLQGRKFVGVELKQSYFDTATRYLREAELKTMQSDMFAGQSLNESELR